MPLHPFLIAALAVHADASEYSNAVYNVVCLAQQVTLYAGEVRHRLWKNELKWSTEDQTQLDRWQSIMRAAETRAPAPPDSPLLANYQSFYPSLRQRTSIVSAALDAKSVNSFQARAARLAAREDAVALGRALRHFQTRLGPWWRRVGRKRVGRRGAIEREFTPCSPRPAWSRRLIRPRRHQHRRCVHARRAQSGRRQRQRVRAQSIRNHFFMELVPPGSRDAAQSSAAKMIAGVAIHELTYALYDSAPVATHLALMRQFVVVLRPRRSINVRVPQRGDCHRCDGIGRQPRAGQGDQTMAANIGIRGFRAWAAPRPSH